MNSFSQGNKWYIVVAKTFPCEKDFFFESYNDIKTEVGAFLNQITLEYLQSSESCEMKDEGWLILRYLKGFDDGRRDRRILVVVE